MKLKNTFVLFLVLVITINCVNLGDTYFLTAQGSSAQDESQPAEQAENRSEEIKESIPERQGDEEPQKPEGPAKADESKKEQTVGKAEESKSQRSKGEDVVPIKVGDKVSKEVPQAKTEGDKKISTKRSDTQKIDEKEVAKEAKEPNANEGEAKESKKVNIPAPPKAERNEPKEVPKKKEVAKTDETQKVKETKVEPQVKTSKTEGNEQQKRTEVKSEAKSEAKITVTKAKVNPEPVKEVKTTEEKKSEKSEVVIPAKKVEKVEKIDDIKKNEKVEKSEKVEEVKKIEKVNGLEKVVKQPSTINIQQNEQPARTEKPATEKPVLMEAPEIKPVQRATAKCTGVDCQPIPSNKAQLQEATEVKTTPPYDTNRYFPVVYNGISDAGKRALELQESGE
jgi:hypothetical protein